MKDELSVRGASGNSAKPAHFGGHRPQSEAASFSGRGEAASTKSLQSKLHEAFAEPANRGILDAAITVERIQRLRGITK